MMKTTAIIACVILPVLLWGQSTYEVIVSDNVYIFNFSAIESSDGALIVPVGRVDTIAWMPANYKDGFLLKIDRYGDTTVKNYYFRDTTFMFNYNFSLGQDNSLITGIANSENCAEFMLLLMKVNAQFEKLWVRFYIFPGYHNYEFDQAFITPYGFILAGNYYEFQHAAAYPLFIKLDHSGNVIDSYSYPIGATERFEYLLAPDSSQIWCFSSDGIKQSRGGGSLIVFDTAFNHLYSKPLSGDMIHLTTHWYSESTFLLGYDGQRPGAPYQDDEHYIQIYDTSLNILHSNYFGSPDTNETTAFRQSVDFNHPDSIYFASWKNYYFGYPPPTAVSWIVVGQVDSTLQPRFIHFIGGDTYYETAYIYACSDGGCFVGARKFHSELALYDLLFFKLNNEGLLVGDTPPGLEIRHALVYPNPATDWLTVETALRDSRIEIYNTIGNLVLTYQINGIKEHINVDHLLRGIYVYKVISENGYCETGKFIKQ